MSTLYIVATPIGNLDDITLRALEVLKNVNLILCEDTRQTKKLLDHYQINKPTLSYHQHSNLNKVEHIIQELKIGQNLALVSDAGTPGISDPGNQLIESVMQEFKDQVDIIPIPGACAITTLASVAGLSMDKFIFMGFPPHKNKRLKFFKELAQFEYPVVLYESTHRIIKTLEQLLDMVGDRQLVVGRELTKKFETIYRGKISEVIQKLKNDSIKGEFVLIINNQ
ncbi:MAG: 16S rRNA (cytidine(1402)-2'-O)-methyltransferase [Patescibacteria group bacterium]|nr:16S rRNA (cytidine(1402)-2'-O)-methyltransferase [Patescibacteria group bacterium]